MHIDRSAKDSGERSREGWRRLNGRIGVLAAVVLRSEAKRFLHLIQRHAFLNARDVGVPAL